MYQYNDPYKIFVKYGQTSDCKINQNKEKISQKIN